MSFTVFADGSANLPGQLLEGIVLLPCTYNVEGVQHTYLGDVDHFDGHSYYESLRQGKKITTSLLNSHLFLTRFRSCLERGEDVIYVSMSSGISGTCHAARIAAQELSEEFPDRTVHIVDSLGCGFGSGLLAVRAAELSRQGLSAAEAGRILDDEVPHMCQYFTVDDLNFLKRSGRVSGATAMIGTVLNIKPILYGNAEGHIVACGKVRGRKKAMEALVEKFTQKALDTENHIVAISHGDCLEEAQALADAVTAIAKPRQLIICQHEPFSGAHVGPGMLALFCYGTSR